MSKVSAKTYNDMPIFTCKLMENDRDYIDNGYNGQSVVMNRERERELRGIH